MSTRTAHTDWTGGPPDGSGTVELVSSKSGSFDVSWPKRTAETGEAGTSPEELIAAAHSSCYAMQLSALIARAGGTPKSLDVTADVSLGPTRRAASTSRTSRSPSAARSTGLTTRASRRSPRTPRPPARLVRR